MIRIIKFFFVRHYTVILFLILILLGCKTKKINLDKGNLHKVSLIEAEIVEDTLFVSYTDSSSILFEDYNALKNNIVVFLNREELSKYKNVQVSSHQSQDSSFVKNYTQSDILFIENLYIENPIFKDFALHITSKFNVSDWWNFRGALAFYNKQFKSDFGVSPVDVLYEFSIISSSNIKETEAYKRLEFVWELIDATGITDVWTQKRVSSKEFILKYNYFFERRNLKPSSQLGVSERRNESNEEEE